MKTEPLDKELGSFPMWLVDKWAKGESPEQIAREMGKPIRMIVRLLKKWRQAIIDEEAYLFRLKRLSRLNQERLAVLMEKNNEGSLSKKEKEELRHLTDEVDRLVLENSIALVNALRPDEPRPASAPVKKRSQQMAKSA
jgi:cell shape-determining protein MreC